MGKPWLVAFAVLCASLGPSALAARVAKDRSGPIRSGLVPPSTRAELLARLPPAMRARTGTYASQDGPNCLNAVSLWHGLARKAVWTSWRALDRHLQDPRRFRRLGADEAVRFGDVAVYRYGPKDMIEHGAIVLDDRWVWEKATAERITPYRIVSRRQSLAPYRSFTIVEHYRRVDAE